MTWFVIRWTGLRLLVSNCDRIRGRLVTLVVTAVLCLFGSAIGTAMC